MTREEAIKLAEDWAALHEEADHELENGCEGAAIEMRAEAEGIEARLREHGFEAIDLVFGLNHERRRHTDPKPVKLTDGVYVTPHGSKVTLGNNGGRGVVEWDWAEEDACPDCWVNVYPEDGFLTWSCEVCEGGFAQLLRLEPEDEHDRADEP